MTDELLQEINENLKTLISSQKQILTVDEACSYLQISRPLLKKEIENGNIRFKQKGVNEKLFKKAWLDEWMEM